MEELSTMSCEACRFESPLVTQQEIDDFLTQLPEWEVAELNGIKRLRRQFRFADFQQALAFTNKVGAIAEEEGHHPEIITEWGKVTVSWWTHKIKGLHVNDFVMAARTNRLL